MRGWLRGVGLGAAVLVLWACIPGDDGFRAKLAAGCATQGACDALLAEAVARSGGCSAGVNDTGECGERFRDLESARALRSKVAQATLAQSAVEPTPPSGADDVYAQFNLDEKRLGSSCADIAELADAGAHVQFQGTADKYEETATKRRAMRGRSLTDSIARTLENRAGDRTETVVYHDQEMTRTQHRVSLASENDPSAYRKGIADAKALVEQLRCYDADAAAKAQPGVDAWAAEWEAAISQEEACRATPKCLADRLAKPLCEALARKKEALAGIAREKRNPSGYVDKVLLHDLGQNVQADDDTIADLRGKYAALVHQPFKDASCPKGP